MQVQSIECQLTQAQVKRYLAGADFPDEVVAAVERHLKACPDCMAEANRQRESLGGAPAEIAQAVVAPTSKPSPLNPIKALFSREKTAHTPPQGLIAPRGANPYPTDPLKAIKTPKNLILSGSLAVVLVVMSTVLRNPTNLFGPKASAKIAATETTLAQADPPIDPTEGAVAKAEHDSESTKHETKADDGPQIAHDAKKEPPAEGHETAQKATPEDTNEAHVSEPVKEAIPVKTEPVAPKAAKPEAHKPVGGQVVVAEAASTAPKSPPKKGVAKTKARSLKPKAKPAAVRPIAQRRATSKISKAPRKSNVRVYLPDGSLKSH